MRTFLGWFVYVLITIAGLLFGSVITCFGVGIATTVQEAIIDGGAAKTKE